MRIISKTALKSIISDQDIKNLIDGLYSDELGYIYHPIWERVGSDISQDGLTIERIILSYFGDNIDFLEDCPEAEEWLKVNSKEIKNPS
jgi:hypothetical protein